MRAISTHEFNRWQSQYCELNHFKLRNLEDDLIIIKETPLDLACTADNHSSRKVFSRAQGINMLRQGARRLRAAASQLEYELLQQHAQAGRAQVCPASR